MRITIHASILILLAAGCAGPVPQVKTYPVSGKVTLNGKPAAGASVMLLPVEYLDKEPTQRPKNLVGGVADEAGVFKLVTNGTMTGAPSGDYRVAVTWADPRVPVDRDGGDRGQNLMPANYRDPRRSDLKFEVKDGQQDQPQLVLDLKSEQRRDGD